MPFVNTYAYLLKAARSHLEQSQRQPDGAFYARMSAIVYSAFTIESYLNHVGQSRVECWEDIEQSLRPEPKLKLIAEVIGFEFEFGMAPFQSFRELFKYRNLVAHGRSIFGKGQSVDDRGLPEAKWQALATPEFAERAVKHTREMICQLSKATGHTGDPFLILAGGVGGRAPAA